MSKVINKYSFLMNDSVRLASLAENEQQAEDRVKSLFGENEKYEMTGFIFSHNSGEFTINTPKLLNTSKTEADIVIPRAVKKVDLTTNVMDAYAKDKKITL